MIKHTGIPLKNVRIKDGKIVKATKHLNVSARIAKRSKKKWKGTKQ